MDTKKNRVMADGIAAGREARIVRVKLSGRVGTGKESRNRLSYSACRNVEAAGVFAVILENRRIAEKVDKSARG